ncbi:MAG: hypothetical protein HDKAJFGB_03657 [Anaerolineae bacterium]|nr:hypothetical protein [Anaerolineae bacterium]
MNMNIPDTTLDESFAIYEEFGPNRLIERKERLQTEFPQLGADEIDFVLDQMNQVSQTVYALAERGGETVIGRPAIEQALQAKHPFLYARGLRHAVFLVNYFAWHDGYEQKPTK